MPPAPSFTGTPRKRPSIPYSPVEVGGAREDALLVEHDRVDHLRDRRADGAYQADRAEQRHDLAAALAVRSTSSRDAGVGEQLA